MGEGEDTCSTGRLPKPFPLHRKVKVGLAGSVGEEKCGAGESLAGGVSPLYKVRSVLNLCRALPFPNIFYLFMT